MAYPEPPVPVSTRVRPDPAQVAAGGVATAIVAALIALVGILVCRWTLGIPILAPSSAGAWGSVHTGEFVIAAAVVAIAATAVLYLLMLGTPQPGLFFRWIMGLVTVAAVVYPFSTGAPLDQKAATAIVDLVLGVAITSLLSAVAARSIRRVYRRRYPDGGYPDGGYPDGGHPAYRDPAYGDGAYRDREYPDRPRRGSGYGGGPAAAGPYPAAEPYPYEPDEGPRNVRRN